MSKRSADRQLSKDDPASDREESGDAADEMEQQGGTWQPASQQAMQGRTIVKARRKAISAPTGVAMPAFNFGATMPPTTPMVAPPAAPAKPADATTTTAATPAVATVAAPTAAAASPSAAGWKCELCDTENEAGLAQCSVCDTAKPATSEAAAPTPKPAPAAPASTTSAAPATTDSAATSSSSAASSSSTAASTSTAAAAPTSVFGSSSTSNGTPSGFSSFATTTPAIFGAGSTSAAPSTFSFGLSEASASPSTFGSVPSFASFSSFGSVASGEGAKGGFFAAAAAAPTVQFEPSSAEHLLTNNEETKAEFKHATAEKTGEENDEVHLKMPTKVYQLRSVPIVADVHVEGEVNAAAAASSGAAPQPAAAAAPAPEVKTQTKYVEIGSGELHVNSVEDQSTKKTRARMVLREDRTKRNVLNAPLFTGMVYKMEGEKFLKMMSLDLDGKLATFLLKVSGGDSDTSASAGGGIGLTCLSFFGGCCSFFVLPSSPSSLCVQFKEKGQAEDVMRAIETCLDIIKS